MVNIKNVFNIVHKDFIEAKNDQGAVVSMLVVPFIFSVVLPLLVILGGASNVLINFIGGIRVFTEQLPANILPTNISESHAMIYAILMYFFIPFFLLIPVMISTILSSSSFTGEKERKTIEGLLYTPITNKELMLGKILASFIPSVIITWLSITVYGIIINIYTVKVMGEMVFPNLNWLIIGLLIAPLITFLSISLVVAISHRVKTSKSAQSISMLLILPIIGFLISQASGVFLFGFTVSLILVIVLIILDFSVYLFISRTFNRGKFITKL
ncbi:ABC transporter permease subunit [Staphylococcus coagulans]|uniref:ABC transporter permease subunit n=1 Tax=Staphylococcus coagulans TaxID=74706 RepID=UPI0015FA3314|nr:ABC transporter permease subunit [Staphylococcus coagulans]MBA8760070.1 ABC transporter permease subunit [Staphylococcus coagulans]MBA8762307.1 ABC transporter permease subunit [Staphylococcus coagulans]MBA8768801.1 ABC transporter permease subunit [Staphylococcus coagulans]